MRQATNRVTLTRAGRGRPFRSHDRETVLATQRFGTDGPSYGGGAAGPCEVVRHRAQRHITLAQAGPGSADRDGGRGTGQLDPGVPRGQEQRLTLVGAQDERVGDSPLAPGARD